MKDRFFLDTNILIYSYSNSELEKQLIARRIITENLTVISTQVLQELCNVVTRKFKFSYEQAEQCIRECSLNNKVYINSDNTILGACRIANVYGFSFYDSIIISAAIESECSILFSEDLHHGQNIENVLTILNPFKV
ncbi:PIN domain-containing protein [Dyadobacter sp. CY345]|uniref:PIN domain-containing protein n=1 Tax=Dyadobacter sp. CY345 TaxID=2909335 RepID=UPI0038D4EBDA